MGFLDNVKEALKGAVSAKTSKDGRARDEAAARDDAAAPAPPNIPATEPTTEPEVRFATHTVKTGDTLSEIAARAGVSVEEIAKLNGIDNPDLIFPGQVFRIPKS